MMRGFFLTRSKSSKIMQTLMYAVELSPLTLAMPVQIRGYYSGCPKGSVLCANQNHSRNSRLTFVACAKTVIYVNG